MESRICDSFEFLRFFTVLILSLILVSAPGARSWSKEGHIVTCRIAQVNWMLVVRDLQSELLWLVWIYELLIIIVSELNIRDGSCLPSNLFRWTLIKHLICFVGETSRREFLHWSLAWILVCISGSPGARGSWSRSKLAASRRGRRSIVAVHVARSNSALVQVQMDWPPSLHWHPRQRMLLWLHK